MVRPRMAKLTTRIATSSCAVSAATRSTTRTDSGVPEYAHVTRISLPTSSARYPRGLIATGTGEECSSQSVVDPSTTWPCAPSDDEPTHQHLGADLFDGFDQAFTRRSAGTCR